MAKPWFRYTSGVTRIDHQVGSKFAGQDIVLYGYGFAPTENATDASASYLESFVDWTNYGSAADYPFGLVVHEATYDRIRASTHLLYERVGEQSDRWDLRGISVNTVNKNYHYHNT